LTRLRVRSTFISGALLTNKPHSIARLITAHFSSLNIITRLDRQGQAMVTKEISRVDISNMANIPKKALENLINREWLDFPKPIRRDKKKMFYCEQEVISFFVKNNIAIRRQQVKVCETTITFNKIFSGRFDLVEKQQDYLKKRIASRINQPRSVIVAVKSDWM